MTILTFLALRKQARDNIDALVLTSLAYDISTAQSSNHKIETTSRSGPKKKTDGPQRGKSELFTK